MDAEGNVLGGQVSNDYRSESGIEEVVLGGLATASLDLGADHSLSATPIGRSTRSRSSVRTSPFTAAVVA